MGWIQRRAEFAFLPPTRGLCGWVRKDLPQELLSEFIRDPESFFHNPSLGFLKNGSKTKVVRQALQAGGGKRWDVVIKRVHYSSGWRRLGFFFRASPAARALKGALLLKGWGISTPSPLAALEYRDWKHRGTSYYLAEEVEGSQSLPLLWQCTPPNFSKEEIPQEKKNILKSLAFLFHQLHSRGIYHQDLKGANILIRRSASKEWQCFVIDVDGVWKSARLGWSRRIKNLAQLYRTFGEHLNAKEKAFFLKRYSDLFSLDRIRRKAIAGEVLSMSRSWKAPRYSKGPKYGAGEERAKPLERGG